MKIPKKIRAFGHTFMVKINLSKENMSSKGSFSFKNKTIEINTPYGDEENIFFHELLEAIMLELGYRFEGSENSMEYIFHFDHSGFSRIHSMFYQILKDNKMI